MPEPPSAGTAEQPQFRRSLYRAYRPQTFAQIVGQDHVTRTLTNAITLGTVAHGYVFAGPRGTGKTSMARILAKALDCTGPDPEAPRTEPTTEPCGVCDSCRRIATAESLDVVEMDAASHRSIDDIRELRDTVAYTPVQSRYKVYIIDEAHMLTREAFNALLKTLEEPPPNVVFVLATTEAHKLPDTIVSRCQRFDFRRPRAEEIVAVLRHVADGEKIEVDDDALETIAEHSQGGFRDAIGALERLATFATDRRVGPEEVLELLGVTDTELLVEVMEIVADADTVEALAFADRLYGRGINWTQFINDLLRHLRRLFLLQHVGHGAGDPKVVRALAQTVGLHPQLVERLEPQASRLDPGVVLRLMELLGQALGDIKAGLDGRLQLEMTLVKITRPELDLSLQGLDARLRRLEEDGGGDGRGGDGRAARGARSDHEDGSSGAARGARSGHQGSPDRPAGSPARQDSRPASPRSLVEDADPEAEALALAEAESLAQPVEAGPDAAFAAAAVDEPHRSPDDPATTDQDPGPAPPDGDPLATATDRGPGPAPPGAGPGTQPQPAPPCSEAPAEGELACGPLLERVLHNWEAVLERVQDYSVPLGSMLRGSRPIHEVDGCVTIGTTSPFERQKLSQAANASIVAGALTEVLRRPLTVTFEVAEGPLTPPESGVRPPHGLSIDEAIALSQEKLDARLLDDAEGA